MGLLRAFVIALRTFCCVHGDGSVQESSRSKVLLYGEFKLLIGYQKLKLKKSERYCSGSPFGETLGCLVWNH